MQSEQSKQTDLSDYLNTAGLTSPRIFAYILQIPELS